VAAKTPSLCVVPNHRVTCSRIVHFEHILSAREGKDPRAKNVRWTSGEGLTLMTVVGRTANSPCKSSCRLSGDLITALFSGAGACLVIDVPPIEQLCGGSRGGSLYEKWGRGALICLLDIAASPTQSSSINMRTSIILLAFVAALIECSRLTPPVLPLLVRNPYLSIWLPNVRQNQPWAHWPMFWTGESIGFSVLAKLPASSTIYPLLGRPQDSLPVNGYVSPP